MIKGELKTNNNNQPYSIEEKEKVQEEVKQLVEKKNK